MLCGLTSKFVLVWLRGKIQMTAMVKGCCVKIRHKLERNYTNTKDKKIRAAANYEKNVIDKSNMNNFLAAINFQEVPWELIYNPFIFCCSAVCYDSYKSRRFKITLYFSHRELLM